MNDEHLSRIATLLHEVANEIESIIAPSVEPVAEEVKETSSEVPAAEVPQEETKPAEEVKPVEEAFLETKAEAVPQKRTVEEAREIVSKALKAKLSKEAKEIVYKYGKSVSEIGEKDPEKLGYLYEEFEALLEANNA